MIFFLVVAACSYSSFFLDEGSLPYDRVEVHQLYDGGTQTSEAMATRKSSFAIIDNSSSSKTFSHPSSEEVWGRQSRE